MTSQDDIDNHRVLQFTRAPGAPSQAAKAHQISSSLRCARVKRSNSPLDFVEEAFSND
jgi:hypothetical protein